MSFLSVTDLEDFADFLENSLSGVPQEMIVALQLQGVHELEQWRQLAIFCDPPGALRNLVDSKALRHPDRAKDERDVLEVITNWKSQEARYMAAMAPRPTPMRRHCSSS